MNVIYEKIHLKMVFWANKAIFGDDKDSTGEQRGESKKAVATG